MESTDFRELHDSTHRRRFEGAHASDAAGGRANATPADAAPSVAVLPFADLSPRRDQEYFTDGMTEELLQALGTIGA
jgi:TolB-like protein